MKPNTIPNSESIGIPIIAEIKTKIKTITANTIIESSVAAMALGNEDSLLKSLEANQTGIEAIIHATRKPIITSIIDGK